MPPMIALDTWLASYDVTQEEVVEENDGPETGTVIGGAYRIIGSLGTGSMGVVLLAHDETLDRRVAIKFTRPTLLSDNFRERFLAEARSMARVSHPNVLQVHAYGQHGDAPYFVMEFVEGRTLEQWLAQSPSPPAIDVALRILDDVCRGVSAIHAQDTVHHDIKPSNILLDDELRPRVADLGLAILYRREQPARYELIGTPAYMAPEIAFSRDPDPALRFRADVYSLACVAYQLFTGNPPFDAATNLGILLQHATQPVRAPSSLRPDLPAELDQAIVRALEKDPVARTPTVEAFRRDLMASRGGSLDPARILVAEDEDESREALRLILAHEFPNAEIECVPDGLAALESFDRNRPSVAILDLMMPGMDGMELTQLLRARGSCATMPIIILTASGGPAEWRRLAALGADRLLVKPVVFDDVVAVVRRALGERSSRGIQQKRGVVEAATPVRPEALRDITMTSAVDITPVNNSFKPGPELP